MLISELVSTGSLGHKAMIGALELSAQNSVLILTNGKLRRLHSCSERFFKAKC